MNETNLAKQTDELEEKVNILVRAYMKLRETSYFAEKENKILKEKNAALQEELKKLKNHQKNSKIVVDSEGKEGIESVEQVKKQINSYVKMLDKCIAHLDG